jgi:hypothetical protein
MHVENGKVIKGGAPNCEETKCVWCPTCFLLTFLLTSTFIGVFQKVMLAARRQNIDLSLLEEKAIYRPRKSIQSLNGWCFLHVHNGCFQFIRSLFSLAWLMGNRSRVKATTVSGRYHHDETLMYKEFLSSLE